MEHQHTNPFTNLPSERRLPSVKVIPNLIGLKKTSIDCHMKRENVCILELSSFEGQEEKTLHISSLF